MKSRKFKLSQFIYFSIYRGQQPKAYLMRLYFFKRLFSCQVTTHCSLQVRLIAIGNTCRGSSGFPNWWLVMIIGVPDRQLQLIWITSCCLTFSKLHCVAHLNDYLLSVIFLPAARYLIIIYLKMFFLVRHAERCDNVETLEETERITNPYDPPITLRG